MDLEKTLVVMKPDAVARGFVGEIISRFEKAWFVIIGCKMINPSKEFLTQHYEWIGKLWTRKWEDILNNVIDMMSVNPVIALVLEWVNAVENVRKLVWPTEPKSAPAGTIRWDYSQISYAYADANGSNINNLIHASADLDEAKQEVALWFNDEELSKYETVHTKFLR